MKRHLLQMGGISGVQLASGLLNKVEAMSLALEKVNMNDINIARNIFDATLRPGQKGGFV